MSAPIRKSEKIVAIKRVGDYLIKGNKVTDDTVIHNLFDSLKINLSSIEAIEVAGLRKFLEDVARNCAELDSSTVVFGLKLAGWLGGNGVYYRHFNGSIQVMLYCVFEKMKSEIQYDVSVITALYECFTLIAQHEEGLLWIVKEEKMQDVTKFGLEFLTQCPSIFLEKVVIKYLSSVMIESERKKHGSVSEIRQKFASGILMVAIENIKKYFSEKRIGPFVPGSLQLLETLCRHSTGTCNLLLTNHIEFYFFIFDKIGSMKPRDCDAVFNIISAVLTIRTEEGKSVEELLSPLMIRIENILNELALEGKITTAQKLASCCLQSECSKSLEQKCVGVLNQPIIWILGEAVEHLTFPEHILQESLSVIRSCTESVCLSLSSNTISVSHVIELLKRTIVYTSCSDMYPTNIATFLYKNRKIQRKCLEIMNLNAEKYNGSSLQNEAQIVVQIFRETDNETVIYSLCSQLLCAWLPTLLSDDKSVSLTTSLAETVQLHLSALQWELRDTTLELLGKIIRLHTDNQNIIKWIVEYRLHVQIWQCINDGESYVRASAISTLYHLCQNQQLLTAFMNTYIVHDESAIIEVIAEIVENDTEAFARRSAVTFLSDFLKDKVISKVKANLDIITDQVMVTMVKATQDFDWEVKLVALNFIHFILWNELSQYVKYENLALECKDMPHDFMINCKVPEARQLYKSCNKCTLKLKKSGLNCRPVFKEVINALISALDDYDEKVSEQALKICTYLQKCLNQTIFKCHHVEMESRMNCEPDLKKTKLNGPDITDTTSAKYKHKTYEHFLTDQQKSSETVENMEHLKEACCNANDDIDDEAADTGGNIKMILDLHLSVYNYRLEQAQDNVSKLVSLVEDIITSSDIDEEENAVDCY